MPQPPAPSAPDVNDGDADSDPGEMPDLVGEDDDYEPVPPPRAATATPTAAGASEAGSCLNSP